MKYYFYINKTKGIAIKSNHPAITFNKKNKSCRFCHIVEKFSFREDLESIDSNGKLYGKPIKECEVLPESSRVFILQNYFHDWKEVDFREYSEMKERSPNK